MSAWNSVSNIDFTLYFSSVGAEEIYVKHMGYINGTLYINARPVASAVCGSSLYWNDNVPDKEDMDHGCSIGRFTRIADTRLFSGTMLTRAGCVRFKASADSAYSMTFTGIGNEIRKEYRLVMGSRMEREYLVQTLELQAKGAAVNLAVSKVYEKEDNGVFHTHIRGWLLPSLDGFEKFGFFDVALDDSYMNLSGYAWAKEETHGQDKPLFSVCGAYEDSDNEWKQRVRALPPGVRPQSPLCGPEQMALLDDSAALDVETLFYLSMPVVEDVNQQYPEMLPKLMKYVISDEQLKYIGNPPRPGRGQEITDAEADLTSDADIRTFLTQKFYYAYLSTMLANNDCGVCSDLIRNIPSYESKLNGYYSGSLSTSMCNDPGYRKLNEDLYPLIYFQSTPEIKPYLPDRLEWARKLHDYAHIEENSLYMLDEYAHQSQSALQHIVVTLNYLDNQKRVPFKKPQKCGFTASGKAAAYSIPYGANLYYKLMNRMIAYNAYSAGFDELSLTKKQRADFYDDAAKELLSSVLAKKELTEDERDLKLAAEEAVKAGIVTVPDDYYPYISFVLTGFEAFMAGATEKAVIPGLADFFTKEATLRRGLRWGAAVLCQGLMVWNQVADYCDWNNLTPAQRAEAVMSSIYTLVDIAGALSSELCSASVADALSELSASSSSAAAGEAEAEQVLSNAEKFLEEAKAGAKAMSTGGKIFGGLLAALAFAMAVCDIVSDQAVYGSGNWLFALDVLVSIVTGLAALASVSFCFISVEFVGACTFAAMLPGIGWACTVLGIILALVAALVKSKTKSLERIYVETYCVPFVMNLETPPAVRRALVVVDPGTLRFRPLEGCA